MKNRKLNRLCLFVCLFGILAAGCSGNAVSEKSGDQPKQSESGGTQGSDAQEKKGGLMSFSAKTLDGGTFTNEDLSDKDLTMVNFWGTFCSPCIAEMPDLAAFEEALPENVQLITVCVDGEYALEDAETLLQQAGYEGVTLISGDGDFAAMLGNVLGVPTTIFLDSEGNLVGDVVEGGGLEDFSGYYLEKINAALKECGKEEISLEE